MRWSGIITTSDWQKLADEADRKNWIKRHDIEKLYSNNTHDEKLEEAVAEQFGLFRTAPDSVPNALRPVWSKVAYFFRRLAAAARRIFGREATANDNLTTLESGKVSETD